MAAARWVASRLPGFSLAPRITVTVVLIVHIPLLTIIGVVVAVPALGPLATVSMATGATVVATIGIVQVLHRLLAPLQTAGSQLEDYLSHRALPPQPPVGRAEACRLLHAVALSCERIEHHRVVLERLALQDSLTGINNRRGAETAMGRMQPPEGQGAWPLSVAVVDVDNLRELNTNGGHAQGDLALQRVAQELQAVLRADDFVARWGGDEFLVVCQCPVAGMMTAMSRVRSGLAHSRDATTPVRVSVSIGIAQLAADEPMDSCITRADVALLAAKTEGRDCIRAAT